MLGGLGLNPACSSRTCSPVFGSPPPRSVFISKVVVTLLMLISFLCKIYSFFVCFDFDSLSAHIHYINAMKLNFTILYSVSPLFFLQHIHTVRQLMFFFYVLHDQIVDASMH